MDRPRSTAPGRRWRPAIAIAGLLALSGVAWGLVRLEAGAPLVAREKLYLAEVRHGVLERKVRGAGQLQPREARWLATRVAARVDRVIVHPGEAVEPGTVIVELSNPEVQRAADAAVLEVAAARADLAAARLELESQRLDRRAALAAARAEAESARLQSIAEQRAYEAGAVSELQAARSRIQAGQLAERVGIEQQRLAALEEAVKAQLEARSARVRQLEREAEERQLAAASLKVRAGMDGVLQSVPVQEGEQLAAGANVARVARPDRLYAELRIPEMEARDLAPGLAAAIDTRERVVRGHVERVDPAVVGGAVRVEVAFDDPLPPSARVDLSVDGTVSIETLADVTFVGRPVGAQPGSETTVFRVKPGSHVAERVGVRFGKASVNQIVVVDGLEPGDVVALADTTQWSGRDRLVID